MDVAIMQPRPLPTLEASLMFHQGAKVAVGSYYTLGRYLFTPEPVETHKPISFFKQLSANLTIVAYDDGTVAYFDTMMKQPLKYFQTGLEIVTGLYPDKNGVLVLTGRDYMRRNVLMVVADNTIMNKQISNYDIKGLLLFNNESYTHGLIAFGFENVRVWKVKKDVLSGSCIYLGEAVRKVSFNSGFMLTNERAYIVSSNGNLNVINVSKCTLEEAVSLDTIELDQIHQLDDHSFVVANSHGTVRVYSIAEFTLLLEIPLEHRIKYLHMNTPNELILTHYNNTLGKLLLSEAKYQFLMRGHSDSILSLHYQQMYKRLVTTSEDGSIRVWRIFADNLSQ
jgi:WD40 repeat protein